MLNVPIGIRKAHEMTITEEKPLLQHPGKVIAERIAQMDINAVALAEKLDVPKNRLYLIINGERGITADTALRLSLFFGDDAAYWLNLQTNYDLQLAMQENGHFIQQSVKSGFSPVLSVLSKIRLGEKSPKIVTSDDYYSNSPEYSSEAMREAERLYLSREYKTAYEILESCLPELEQNNNRWSSPDYVLNGYLRGMILQNEKEGTHAFWQNNLKALRIFSDLFARMDAAGSVYAVISDKEGMRTRGLMTILEKQITELHQKIMLSQGVMYDRKLSVMMHYRALVDILAGSPSGSYRLALLHFEDEPLIFENNHVEMPDKKKGGDLLHKAAEEGYINAQMYLYYYYLGYLGHSGDHVNEETAKYWLEKACEQQLPEALMNRDKSAHPGDRAHLFDINSFQMKMMKYWGADENGILPQKCYEMAYHYEGRPYDGYGDLDRNEAFLWYLKGANKGDVTSQYYAGLAYEEGCAIPAQANYKGLYWYMDKLHTRSNPDDIAFLHHLYKTPEKIQDTAQAGEWYGKSAAQGYADAQYRLGLLYMQGNGIARDFVQAYRYLNMAASQKHEAAKVARDALEEKMEKSDISQAQSLSRRA